MPNPNRIENRANPRHRYIAETTYGSDQEIGRGLVRNISLGGAMISADTKPSVGTDLLITVPFARSFRFASLRGTVERISGDGFAISFTRRKRHHNPHNGWNM
jgi:hypothetical protein